MKCIECGTENPPVARFCFSCGRQLASAPAPALDSPGLRVRAPKPAADEGVGATSPSMEAASPVVEVDRAVTGLAETAPFEPSPFGRDTQPESPRGLGVADTIIDLPKAEAERLAASLAIEIDTSRTLDEAPARGAKSASPAVSETTWALEGDAATPRSAEPAWSASEAPADDSSRLSAEGAAGAVVATAARREAPPAEPRAGKHEPSWSEGPAISLTGAARSEINGELLDFELRRVNRVRWIHRVLVAAGIALLAGAAYFAWVGVSAMRVHGTAATATSTSTAAPGLPQ